MFAPSSNLDLSKLRGGRSAGLEREGAAGSQGRKDAEGPLGQPSRGPTSRTRWQTETDCPLRRFPEVREPDRDEASPASLSLRRLEPADASAHLAEILARPYEYRGWEDVYRDEWTWDKVVKVTHTRVNCISACSLDAYVKDGIVWREERTPPTRRRSPTCPTSIRAAARPGSRLRGADVRPDADQVPDEAGGRAGIGEVAAPLLGRGPHRDRRQADRHGHPQGWPRVHHLRQRHHEHRLRHRLADGEPPPEQWPRRASTIDSYAGVGDLPVGLIQAWGLYMSEGTADDWFLTDYALIWIGNPSYTRVPEAHFLYEARYRGAKIVTIAPDFSASTMHADRWLNPRYAHGRGARARDDQRDHQREAVQGRLHQGADGPPLPRPRRHETFLATERCRGRWQRRASSTSGTPTPAGRLRRPGTWGSTRATIRLDEDVDPSSKACIRFA